MEEEGQGEEWSFSETREIRGAIEDVWSVYTDHESWPLWTSAGAVSLDPEATEGEDRNGVGCVRVIKTGGVVVLEKILSFDAPYRMTYSVVDNFFMHSHFGEVLMKSKEDSDEDITVVTW
eukprot:CAMPEP_0174257904 /NCGR_PEP_ID=MMETSP0439-20130205/7001_1 /TAXON_ID=0 /ORGANISM="Stereomyxa ramosa, Strain Chinc5" /LENGTH=119 /DNA_ID=CAMNT_0015341205 /DNA_START=6 /DNA_END=362 /DNA_ORIENTATION=-